MAGRPAAPRQISSNVLPVAQLANVDITPRELYSIMENRKQFLQWLATHRLIRNAVQCSSCQRAMAVVSRAESSDGFSWHCCQCNTRCSVKTGSFFANCEIPTEKIVVLFFY